MESNKRHITDQDYEDIIEILEQMLSSSDYRILYDKLLAKFREIEELSPIIVLRPSLRIFGRNKQKQTDVLSTGNVLVIRQMIDAASEHKPKTLTQLFMQLRKS